MNLNSLTKIRRLSPQLSIAGSVVALVLLIATSVFYFICYSYMFDEQVYPIYILHMNKLLFTARLYRDDIISCNHTLTYMLITIIFLLGYHLEVPIY
jgi:hypothetical protein